MVEPKTWAEFRKTGLLLIINQLLHVFGWAIVVELDEQKQVVDCYPARVKFRGFEGKAVEESYRNVSEYMKDNADELLKEASE